MVAPKVIVGAEDRASKGPVTGPERASSTWGVLWWIGILLLLAGLVDLGLAFYPPNFGEPTWRFEAAASVANGLPLPIVGLLTATMAALAGRRPGRARFALVLNVAATLFLVGLVLMFALSTKQAFTVADPGVQIGLSKAVFKTVLFCLVFGAASAASVGAVARRLREAETDV